MNSDKAKIEFSSFNEHISMGPIVRPYIVDFMGKWRLALAACVADYPNRFSNVQVQLDSLPAIIDKVEARSGELIPDELGGKAVSHQNELAVMMQAATRLREFTGQTH